jgi:hypothetical protein
MPTNQPTFRNLSRGELKTLILPDETAQYRKTRSLVVLKVAKLNFLAAFSVVRAGSDLEISGEREIEGECHWGQSRLARSSLDHHVHHY